MKKIVTVFAFSLLALSAYASADSNVNIGSGPCPTGVNGFEPTAASVDYLTNNQNQVEMHVLSYYGSDGYEDSVLADFTSDIVPSLTLSGNKIIDTSTGTVCATVGKDIFGQPTTSETGNCTMTITQSYQDSDGFHHDDECVFTYDLKIN